MTARPSGALGGLLGEQVQLPLFGPVSGRGTMLALVTLVVLALAGAAALWSGRAEVRTRWATWAVIAPLVGLPVAAGRTATAVLAVAVAVVACLEYARMLRLTRADAALLVAAAVLVPLTALLRPDLMHLLPVLVMLAAAPALLSADAERGFERATVTGFAVIWICWSLSVLVLLWPDAYLLFLTAAVADVGAWCTGKGLRGVRIGGAHPFAQPLSRLSVNKTVGGVIGSVAGAALVLGAFGILRPEYMLAVGLGTVAGDLIESMAKRQAGVKDAGQWLPGFGGLLDRVDSLLLVLPIALVLR